MKSIWGYMQHLNKTKNTVWLDMIENCTFSEDPLEVAAAYKILARYEKENDVTHTG